MCCCETTSRTQTDICRTCENFRQFCTGEYRVSGRPTGYKNTLFHRILKNSVIEGGDFIKGNGQGSTTIYGSTFFPDEGFYYDRKY